ncbi:MAG TPA: phosphatidylglycerol lysyltransferase domain-containing protein, partial [Candidatus Binatia bacterium]|nr:phosphatidylglycerol lysyltransferase domain-containing protein [Candidatus Binatia bacterium]
SLALNHSLFDLRTILTLGLAAWLLRMRPHFHARSDPPSVREGGFVILSAVTFLLVYCGAGIYVLALRSGEAHDLEAVVTATIAVLVSLRPPAWLMALDSGRFLVMSIYSIAVLTLLYAFFQLLRPVLLPRPASPAERARASVLVTAYGRNAISRLALLPDVSYYFSEGGSVVAFMLAGRTAVALGDPIGPEGDSRETIDGFAGHCRRNDWVPAFYQATEAYLHYYESAGFDTMAVGREAIVDVSEFAAAHNGAGNLKDVSRLLHRGYRAACRMPPHPPELIDELRLINDEWLTIMRDESFAHVVSHFDESYVAQSPVMTTETPRSLVSAFATLIMDPGGESLAIDVLRHRPQIREGTLELLILALIQWAQRHEFHSVNLGAAFPGFEDEDMLNGMSRTLLDGNGESQAMSRLYEVRARFNPRWQPRYLVYPGATSLPAVWSAVTRERTSEHWLWQLVKQRLGL